MKKILAICLVIALAATAIIGGTLAYFTDTDNETNTFTLGDVKIALEEKNGDSTPFTQNQKLMPGEENAIDKVVTVKNTGSEDAYMWVELWIPAALDTIEDAGANDLHFNPFFTFEDENGNLVLMRKSVADAKGYKQVYATNTVAIGTETRADKDGNTASYNGYRVNIVDDTAHKTGESTPALLARVFMDARVSQCTTDGHAADCRVLVDGTHYDGSWEIIVDAFGIQAAGFDNITEAMAAYYAA